MDITLKSRKNKHLNAKECYIIEALLKVKFKASEIAKLFLTNNTYVTLLKK